MSSSFVPTASTFIYPATKSHGNSPTAGEDDITHLYAFVPAFVPVHTHLYTFVHEI